MKWAVVVPTNRPDRFTEFLEAWDELFDQHDVKLIVVQDLPAHDDQIHEEFSVRRYAGELHHWGSIGAKHIPHRTDMVRSWGIYRAWKLGSRYTLTLDDDVTPACDVFAEYERVFEQDAVLSDYLDVGALTTSGKQMRGFPFRDRKRAKVALQYGGWSGVLDYDAPTQLAGVSPLEVFGPVVLPVPRGAAVTGCIMNAAWRTEYAPIMWQLPLHRGKFNRFGDIWAGLFAKRVLDAVGKVVVVNGRALVNHDRASDPVANLEREMPGIPPNENIWRALDGAVMADDTLEDAYESVTDRAAQHLASVDHDYAQHFREARDEWLALYR